MTKLTYESHNNEIHIELKGHAGFAEYGTDIVCSAISVLIQTLMAYLYDNADECDTDIEEGYARIDAKGGDTRVSFDTIMRGFELIEESYPDYLEIEKKGVL